MSEKRPVTVLADGEGAFTWLQHEKKVREGEVTHLSALPRGMVGGRASVTIVGRMKDGSVALLQTSLRTMLGAQAVWLGHYGPEADGSSPPLNAATQERLMAALMLKLIKEREGGEVTIDVAQLNAVMQDASQGIEMEYAKDGLSLTIRAQRSE
jgi:hypothetical protein